MLITFDPSPSTVHDHTADVHLVLLLDGPEAKLQSICFVTCLIRGTWAVAFNHKSLSLHGVEGGVDAVSLRVLVLRAVVVCGSEQSRLVTSSADWFPSPPGSAYDQDLGRSFRRAPMRYAGRG
jgi:hypothetical protein